MTRDVTVVAGMAAQLDFVLDKREEVAPVVIKVECEKEAVLPIRNETRTIVVQSSTLEVLDSVRIVLSLIALVLFLIILLIVVMRVGKRRLRKPFR